jgi:transaldolase
LGGAKVGLFVSRWDVAVADRAPETLRNKLGIAIAGEAYERYRTLLDSPRWLRILNEGARPQRLVWASTGTKDPKASNILYVEALALPFTINTMPEATLKALAAHEEFGEAAPAQANEVLAEFAKAGIDTNGVAAQLLGEGVASFAKSWNDLLDCIASKSQILKAA